MEFPAVVTTQGSDLPQIESLWKKIKFDLGQGFKVKSYNTHLNHVVRVFTKHPALGWRFLIVASASDTMPPVFSVELHAYPQGETTWKLNLKYQPLAEPHWQQEWVMLRNMHKVDEEVGLNKQSEVVNAYLVSEFDKESTVAAYERVGYDDKTAQWFGEKSLG